MTWLGTRANDEWIGEAIGIDFGAMASGLGTLTSKGSVVPKVGAAIGLVQTAASGINELTGAKEDPKVAEVTNGIRSVTRNPIVGAALAATALVVPVGTAIAAVGAAALAVTEGVCAIADEIGKLFGGGGPSPEQRAEWKKLRLRWRDALYKAMYDLAISSATMLAPTYVDAHYAVHGGGELELKKLKQSQAKWAAAQVNLNPQMQEAMFALKSSVKQISAEGHRDMTGEFNRAYKRQFQPHFLGWLKQEVARIVGEREAVLKQKLVKVRQPKKVRAAVKKAAAGASKVLRKVAVKHQAEVAHKRANRRQEASAGILVGEGGRIARGKFVPAKSGPRRLLVSANGKIRAGHWTKAKAA